MVGVTVIVTAEARGGQPPPVCGATPPVGVLSVCYAHTQQKVILSFLLLKNVIEECHVGPDHVVLLDTGPRNHSF